MIQCDLLVLNDEGFLDRRFQQFKHRMVVEIVTNMFQNIAVSYDAKRSEDDDDGDIRLDIRQGCFDRLTGRLNGIGDELEAHIA